ncbi:MAG: hypothetical protein EXS22_01600 [Pedosphaera sp.]|nr:hypothetical protein [Pedosphaera sp.]MSU42721.1 hypothetical protein [Pedosphaera sp.]
MAASVRTLAPAARKSGACLARTFGIRRGMFPYITQAQDGKWQPGPYAGVELMVLHKDEATGGATVLRKFHAGTTIPAHTHRLTNETAYVLSGEWVESDVVHLPGTLFFAPKGTRHGPHHAKTEVISLTHFDGPLTLD